MVTPRVQQNTTKHGLCTGITWSVSGAIRMLRMVHVQRDAEEMLIRCIQVAGMIGQKVFL